MDQVNSQDRLLRAVGMLSDVMQSGILTAVRVECQYSFPCGQEQAVALTARQKFDPPVGLSAVGFEAQWQILVRVHYAGAIGSIGWTLWSRKHQASGYKGKGNGLLHRIVLFNR
jgi:hypothetical protein